MNVYLKPNVQVDPLFNQWYAWNLLVPPVTAAINTLERHIKMMTSFVNAPAMHAAALKNRKMRGGMFIDLDPSRAPEVKQLLADTQARCGKLIEFAKAMTQLTRLLQDKAKGMAMETLYAEIPEPLQGYVELCYDMANNPFFRVHEALLYRSGYYAENCQSIALSEIVEDRKRPFMLSTPRLADASTVMLPIPFADPRLDQLFRMKRTPQPFDTIAGAFDGLATPDQLRPLFTETAPPRPPRYTGDGMRVRYFGHATLLIETKDVAILTDPIISYNYGAAPERFTFDDLPESIDYVLLTHSHHDHVHFETLLQIRHLVKHIVVPRNFDGFPQDPSLVLALKHTGFTNLIEVRDLDEIAFPGGRIVPLPFLGEHHDLNVQSRSIYRVEAGGRSLLAIADSGILDPRLFDEVVRLYGKSDLLFLGMECEGAPASWIYGPMFTKPLTREVDQSRRARGSNYEEAVALIERMGFSGVYVYAMGQEPWLSHILDNELEEESKAVSQTNTLLAYCAEHGIDAENLFGKKELTLG
jgi:L-ascorbate metabolism protein UlaG (beta-lactamase superfamily)